MLSPKKLMEKARSGIKASTQMIADKGHFVVYSAEGQQYVVPLKYLNNPVIQALLEMSEDEYGLPGDGPIMLPCDAAFMEYLLPLVRRNPSKKMEDALLLSVTRGQCFRCSFSVNQEKSQWVALYGC